MAEVEAAVPETYESVANLLELVLLRPDLSADDIAEGCRIAATTRIAAVVVRPCDADFAVTMLRGSGVAVGAAVGHPYGYSNTAAKLYEARDLIRQRVQEIEFTINGSKLVSRQFQHVETELMQIVKSCQEEGIRFKAVLTNRFLQDDLKIIATKIVKRVEGEIMAIEYRESDFTLLKPILRGVLKLKCVGPVDKLDDILAMRAHGFERIGTTQPESILQEWKKRLEPAQPQSVTT